MWTTTERVELARIEKNTEEIKKRITLYKNVFALNKSKKKSQSSVKCDNS